MRLIDADKLKEDFECSDTLGGYVGDIIHKLVTWVTKIIDDAPTVEPCTDCCESMKQAISEFNANYRKKGKWIKVVDKIEMYDEEGFKSGNVIYQCPICGLFHNGIEDRPLYNFCPDCGADMRGTE